MKILFIGNSFTYFNAIPEGIFAGLCASMGKQADIKSITKGGYKLSQFADPENEHGKRLRALLAVDKFDLAVLQEQSVIPAADPEAFFAGVRSVHALLQSHGINDIILYQTWGHLKGSKRFDDLGITTEQMETLIRSSYLKMGEELKATVALAGKAFLECMTKHPGFELISKDFYHPAYAGSYLASLVIYKKVWGESVTSGAFHGELDIEMAEKLIAFAAVQE